MRKHALIILLLISGCAFEGEINQPNLSIPDTLFTKHPEFNEINIPVGEEKSIPLEDIATDVDFIPLESRQEAFLKRADDVFINDSLILVNTRENLKYFDRNGKYQFTFENSGRGPSEYTTIFGFAVDFSSNKMAIADLGLIKLYDIRGNFLKTLELPGPPFALTPNIAFLESHYLLMENDRY